jgi:membrane-bound serine protease (ClpP class)
VIIRMEGPITSMLEQYLFRKLDEAKALGADLVIVEIDSPGGLLQESLGIADRLGSLPWAHTVAYVPREALSGAAIAALGAKEIVMGPHARLGDAGPIFQGEDFLFRHAPEKIRSDLALRMRNLAEANGRPPALAEAMVDMNLVVYHAKNKTTGQETYLSDKELDALKDRDDWEKLNPVLESQKGRFLEVNGRRAVELGLAEAVVANSDGLRQRYQLQGDLPVLQATGVDTAVYILNLPLVTGLLFIIGLVALYVEFSAPGIGIGGLLAGLCFALFFWSRFMGGTAGWLEVILFLAGAVFLAVEIFVIPGFGVAGLTGILLIIASLLLAGQNFVVPKTVVQWETLGTDLLVVFLSGTVFLAVGGILTWYLGTIPILGRMVLAAPDSQTDKPAQEIAAAVAQDGAGQPAVQVGDVGVADSPLRPAGRVRFGETYVDVVTEGSFIEEGVPVRVLQIRGNRILVRRVD